MKTNELSVLRLNAGNDRNGNPRRLFLVMHPESGVLAAIDEEYSGRGALNVFGKTLGEKLGAVAQGSPLIATTPSEYKSLLKTYGVKSTDHWAVARREKLMALGVREDKKAAKGQ